MEEAKSLVKKLFKNSDGLPFEMTNGQAIIFILISTQKFPRVHIETPTRYGKSDVISMAVLTDATIWPGKWSIVAQKKEKASIIMSYAIGHIFDNEGIRRKFIIGKGESEEEIRRYRKKDRINFDLGGRKLGELFISTAKDALGFGASKVVEDESGLVPSKEHGLVMRMLGDKPENFICKVGNPWDEEHFVKSFKDPSYKKVIIDYKMAIEEGRLTPEYVEEMRKQPFFDVLYECNFPKSGVIDEKGWIPLLSREEIEKAFIRDAKGFGINKLGVDVAGGGRNKSVVVQRRTNLAEIIHRTKSPDTMDLAEFVINKRIAEGIHPADINVDMLGVGKGTYDVLNREKTTSGIHGINAGSEPYSEEGKTMFINLRAQMFWELRKWILAGGKLLEDEAWYQLNKIKYRQKLEGRQAKMQIISKEEMLKEGMESPDEADALALTFATADIPRLDEEELELQEIRQKQGWDPMAPFGKL